MSYTQQQDGSLKILEDNHYYPYGMKHSGYNAPVFDYLQIGSATQLSNVTRNKNQFKYNGQEFGNAGKAGKLLRMAFRSLLLNSDNRVVSRLVRDFLKVIQSDPLGARGLRRVMAGNVVLMRGFEFNIRAPFSSMFYAPYTMVIDRVVGTATVEVPAFSPYTLLQAPQGTTHFKFVSGGAVVDFDARTFVGGVEESAFLPWDLNLSPLLTPVHSFPANSTDPLFVMLGISFYQEVNGICML